MSLIDDHLPKKELLNKLEEMFIFLQPKRVELLLRPASKSLDPLDDIGLPEGAKLFFLHIAVVTDQWEGNVDGDSVEEAIDMLNRWVLVNTKSDILVGSLNFLSDDEDSLPDALERYGIYLDGLEYDHFLEVYEYE